MSQLEMNFPPRELGICSAVEHADRVTDGWSDDALDFLRAFARANYEFIGEDVSDAHIAAHLPQPPDLRAWGMVYRRATREGLIRRVDNNGWSRRRSSPCPRYESLIYGG